MRADYNRTYAEISRMDIDTQIDLNIYAGDAHAIAHKSVYGS